MSQPSTWPLTKEAFRILVPFNRFKNVTDSTFTKNCYPTAIGFYPRASLHHMNRANHDDFILIYCAEGSGVVELKNQRHFIQRGDAFILPPNHQHTYFSDPDKPWTIYWCHFKGEAAENFFNNIYKQVNSYVFSVTEASIRSIFEEMLDVASATLNEQCFIHLCSTISYLLTKLERSVSVNKQNKFGAISDVQFYLRRNISKKISLDELASLSGLSKFYFVNQYKEVTGYSPLKHFQVLKMEQASFLLEQSKMNISEIAFATGFEDSLYFSRCFRKHFGVSPSIYRKNLNASL